MSKAGTRTIKPRMQTGAEHGHKPSEPGTRTMARQLYYGGGLVSVGGERAMYGRDVVKLFQG